MPYFLSIFVLVFSLSSLGSNSCKEQKKLLKSTCSFKKEKIKPKNLPSLNSCKKIKDLFSELKTKTKENYESCKKAYDTCTELCNRCDKSLVTSFKEKSKKKLKKIKKGFKKASKCVSQLSSDFEEKDKKQSFSSNPYTKEFLKYLKAEKLKEKKKQEIEYQKFLKEKEKIEFGKKLGNKFRQIDKRLKLNQWARKHNMSVSGKSTKEIKQMKIDYEVKQIKKEGRRERLKLEKQRRESLKKKFEADFLKTNPPKTKTTMVFEAVKGTFSSYWTKAKSFFGRVFFGEFASAYGGFCRTANIIHKEDLNKINDFIHDLENEYNETCKKIRKIIIDEITDLSPKKAALFAVGVAITLAEILIKISRESGLCETHELVTQVKKQFNELNETNNEVLRFLETKNNNAYHVFSYFFSIREGIRNGNIQSPFLQNLFARYQTLVYTYGVDVIIPLIAHSLKGFHPYLDNLLIQSNYSNIPDHRNQVDRDAQSYDYKTPLSTALDEVIKAAKNSNDISYMEFYERYIASLIYIVGLKTDTDYTKYVYAYGDQVGSIETVVKEKLKDSLIESYSDMREKKEALKNVRACF